MNLTRFSPQRDEIKIRLRKAYGYRKSDFILLFAAELNHNKHQDLLIDTAKLLSDRGRSIILLLAGEGEKGRDYRKRVSDLNLRIRSSSRGGAMMYRTCCKLPILPYHPPGRRGCRSLSWKPWLGLPVVATGCRGNRDLIAQSERISGGRQC